MYYLNFKFHCFTIRFMISKFILKMVVYFKNNLYFKIIFIQKRKLLLSDMSKLILSL